MGGPHPSSAQFSVPPGPQRLEQRPGAPGPRGERVHCGTRQGVRPASTCQLQGASHRDRADPGVSGCGELSHKAFPQKTQRKGVLTPSGSLFLSFFLTVWYILVCCFVHPCDCHFINSCVFCIFHIIRIVSRMITI